MVDHAPLDHLGLVDNGCLAELNISHDPIRLAGENPYLGAWSNGEERTTMQRAFTIVALLIRATLTEIYTRNKGCIYIPTYGKWFRHVRYHENIRVEF